MRINPLTCADAYKLSHKGFMDEATEVIYSNMTGRTLKYLPIPTDLHQEHYVVFGLQHFIKDFLIKDWNELFFQKSKAEVRVFDLPKEKKEKFDNFLIANAFTNKDKLNTWIYFRQSIDLGVSLEEINGVLFWKIKDMILKKNFNKFKDEQLKYFIEKLSYLLPEARKNGVDAESAFEQFLLEAF